MGLFDNKLDPCFGSIKMSKEIKDVCCMDSSKAVRTAKDIW